MIYRATIAAADMPKDLQQPYPTFWAGPGWHVIYYPMRDWSTFNLGCTVVTSQTPPNDGEDVSPHYVLPLFAGSCAAPLRVLRLPKQFSRYVIRHREPVENWTDGAVTLLGDAAHPMVQYIAQGAAMALEDAICLAGARGRDATAISPGRSSATRTSARAHRAGADLVADDGPHQPRQGLERKVRNSLFEGRTAEEFYDRLAWLYTPPSYVK